MVKREDTGTVYQEMIASEALEMRHVASEKALEELERREAEKRRLGWGDWYVSKSIELDTARKRVQELEEILRGLMESEAVVKAQQDEGADRPKRFSSLVMGSKKKAMLEGEKERLNRASLRRRNERKMHESALHKARRWVDGVEDEIDRGFSQHLVTLKIPELDNFKKGDGEEFDEGFKKGFEAGFKRGYEKQFQMGLEERRKAMLEAARKDTRNIATQVEH
jgi:flagellar biosynthesis/type III secretory pathway protein FliH